MTFDAIPMPPVNAVIADTMRRSEGNVVTSSAMIIAEVKRAIPCPCPVPCPCKTPTQWPSYSNYTVDVQAGSPTHSGPEFRLVVSAVGIAMGGMMTSSPEPPQGQVGSVRSCSLVVGTVR